MFYYLSCSRYDRKLQISIFTLRTTMNIKIFLSGIFIHTIYYLCYIQKILSSMKLIHSQNRNGIHIS